MAALNSKINGGKVIVRGPKVPEYTKEVAAALTEIAASVDSEHLYSKRHSRIRSKR